MDKGHPKDSMRASCSVLGLVTLSLGACTMLNPAFESGDESEATSRETGVSSVADEAAAESLETGSVSVTSAEEVGTTSVSGPGESADGEVGITSLETDDTDTTGGNVCVLAWDEPLRFKVVGEGVNDPCPPIFDADVLVLGTGVAGGIAATVCGEGCGNCVGGDVELEAYPEDLGEIAAGVTGECITAHYDALIAQSSGSCEYGRAFVHYQIDTAGQTPLFLGSNIDKDSPNDAYGFLSDADFLPWELAPAEACECDSLDPCCSTEDPPAIYDLSVAGNVPLSIGDVVDVDHLGVAYEFQLEQAQLQDSCGAPVEVSWLMRAVTDNP